MVMDELQCLTDIITIAPLYTKVITTLITFHSDKKDTIEEMLYKILNVLVNPDHQKELTAFLSTLEQNNHEWHRKACIYLKNI